MERNYNKRDNLRVCLEIMKDANQRSGYNESNTKIHASVLVFCFNLKPRYKNPTSVLGLQYSK